MIRWIAPVLCGLLVVACESKPEPAPTPSKAPESVAAKPASPAAPVAVAAADVADDALPTEEDFADEVAKDITEDNFEAEVDKLDKEVGE